MIHSLGADQILFIVGALHWTVALAALSLLIGGVAGFVVAICGDIMTMPGLPRGPASDTIRLDADGQIDGLF